MSMSTRKFSQHQYNANIADPNLIIAPIYENYPFDCERTMSSPRRQLRMQLATYRATKWLMQQKMFIGFEKNVRLWWRSFVLLLINFSCIDEIKWWKRWFFCSYGVNLNSEVLFSNSDVSAHFVQFSRVFLKRNVFFYCLVYNFELFVFFVFAHFFMARRLIWINIFFPLTAFKIWFEWKAFFLICLNFEWFGLHFIWPILIR